MSNSLKKTAKADYL